MKILLIADDSFDQSRLCVDRQSVTWAGTPDEALTFLAGETFDVVIVDVSATPEARMSFISRWCMPAGHTPPLALTGRHNDDRVRALGLGADDARKKLRTVGADRLIATVKRRRYQIRKLGEPLPMSTEIRRLGTLASTFPSDRDPNL